MADNGPAASATNIAWDDIGSTQYQRIKLIHGADGVNAGDVSTANPYPVTNRVTALTLTTGTITTSTSTVTATTDIPNAGTVTVVIAGTYAGVNVTFEASLDGTTWVPIMAQRVDAYEIGTTSGVLASNTTRGWDVPLPGFTQFRVRATAYTSGTANVGILPAVNPFEVAPTVGKAPFFGSTDVSLASSASSAQVLAANTSRRGLILTNTDVNTVYIYCGTTATTTKFTIPLQQNETWIMDDPWTGRIDAIWAADGSGSLIGQEFT